MTNPWSGLRWTARLVLVLLVAGPLAACGPGPLVVPRVSSASALGAAADPVLLTTGPLALAITSPANDAVVHTPQVVLSGTAPPDTVISINDTLVVVDASGQFSATVALDAGPNELAIQASNPDGNAASSRLIVTYEPSS
jgi:hypothetical protein